jgi:hypothetical protein
MGLELAEKAEDGEAEKDFENSNESASQSLKMKLKRVEDMNIFWPFEFKMIEDLDSMKDEPAFQKLIQEKMDVLKNILGGMDQERKRQEDMKEIYRPWGKKEQNVYDILKGLTGDSKRQ